MFRPSRTVALVGGSVLLAVLGPAAPARAATPPGAASQVASSLAQDPSPAPSLGSMPGLDSGSMPGLDSGSMPGMDDGSMAGMPGMADDHQPVVAVSRPLGWVAGTFAVVNGLMMAAAAVLRRRRPARPAPRRPRPAAA